MQQHMNIEQHEQYNDTRTVQQHINIEQHMTTMMCEVVEPSAMGSLPPSLRHAAVLTVVFALFE